MSSQPVTNSAALLGGQTPEPVVTQTPDPIAAQAGGVATWVDTLPETFRQNEAITSYESFDKLLEDHVNIKSAYKPAPTTPDEYGLALPENLPEGLNLTKERLDKYATKALELGIAKEALPELFKLHMEEIGLDVQAYEEQKVAIQTDRDTKLQELWGDNFNQNAQAVSAFLESFATPEEKAFLAEHKEMLNYPPLLNLLAKAGMAASPATKVGAASTTAAPSFAGSPQQQATAKIQQLMTDKAFQSSMMDPLHPQHKNNVEYWSKLHHEEVGTKVSN